jgi:hypothetical protein
LKLILIRVVVEDDGCGAAGIAVAAGGVPLASASSCRIKSLTKSEASSPQDLQTNCTGVCAISGVMSKLYFAPHGH